jgi:proline utilization trans-activator
LKKAFESPQEVQPLISSRKIRQLLQMSVEASQKILGILGSLHEQGLLGKLFHFQFSKALG